MRNYALTVDEVLQVVEKWKWQSQSHRKINAVHLHHTISPRESFSGVADLQRLAPQHATIDPAGLVWTGLHWDVPPDSIPNANGDAKAGPFSITLVGDFERDSFDGAQRSTAVTLIAEVLRNNKLSEAALVVHREKDASMPRCPGGNVDAQALREDVAAALARPPRQAAAPRVTGPFSAEFSAAAALLEDLNVAPPARPPHSGQSREAIVENAVALGRGLAARDTVPPPPKRKLDTAAMVELLPHVVNLTQGLLSDEGKFKTRPHHIVEMFQSIQTYINGRKQENRTPRVVFFAHGGLNSEEAGLEGALNQLKWWKDNGIYPVFFVWETGLLASLHFVLRPKEGTRNIFTDHVSDPLIERTVHAIGGVQVWGNMKQSAERAGVHPLGGSNIVAQKLAALMTAEPKLEVHAIGHSAGAIFHAHFLDALARAGAPRDVSTLHFFAPAIRVDEFKKHVIPRIGAGKGVASMSTFTMRTLLEEDDNCVTIYRKSLLCLIRGGLEPKRDTPILGLEDSIADDKDLRDFYGLTAGVKGRADLVFSLSPAGAPPERRCSAKAHGAFDNNVDTMNSAASRILGSRDAANLISFATSSAAERAFAVEDPMLTLPGDVREFLMSMSAPSSSLTVSPVQVQTQTSIVQPIVAGGMGRRRALCVGINDYGSQSLQFCVADAQLWAQSLAQQGFATTMLTDRDATRQRILDALAELVRDSGPGDSIVFQYAGHGTTAPDVDGDEAKTGRDFACVPVDFEDGALVLDDDLFAIWRELKEGVTATSFVDACHSGNGLRMLVRGQKEGLERRARFITLTPEQQRKHIEFRRARGLRAMARVAEVRGTAIFFGACTEDQVALERDGHGDYSRAAAAEIANAARLTNRAFHDRVLAALNTPLQTPQWDAAPQDRRAEIGEQPLLQAITQKLQIAGTRGRGLALTPMSWRRNLTPQPDLVTR